jgi:hypothetical protein
MVRQTSVGNGVVSLKTLNVAEGVYFVKVNDLAIRGKSKGSELHNRL